MSFEQAGQEDYASIANELEQTGRMLVSDNNASEAEQYFRQALHYAQSALLVRYLLDEDGHLGSGFRRYLANIAEGGDPGPRALFQALGVSADQLDEGFWDWLARMRLDPRIEAGRILTP